MPISRLYFPFTIPEADALCAASDKNKQASAEFRLALEKLETGLLTR